MTQTGYLFINLGTPDTPAVADVRRYLGQFLMDPYVLDVPAALRWMIVNGFILPFRPRRSAEAYAAIWEPDGSPLLLHCQALVDAMHTRLDAPAALGMRYGQPAIADAVAELVDAGVQRIVTVPLYPHYADSTVTTSIAETRRAVPSDVEVHVLPPFYEHPLYIQALLDVTQTALPNDWDHLLMSYHGLPERHLRKADPTRQHCLQQAECCKQPSTAHATCYRHQVYATSNALAQALGIPAERYTVSFQSRLGSGWMQPFTDQLLAQLPTRGVRRLAVVCPAFVADNLETLEEMNIQGRATFLQAGGEHFELIPCLNTAPAWLDALTTLLQSFTAQLDTTVAAANP